jgi:hypothetical protein
MTLAAYAQLVLDLRNAQKANGLGYKTPAATTSTTALEQKVDAATAKALEGWPYNAFESIDS